MKVGLVGRLSIGVGRDVGFEFDVADCRGFISYGCLIAVD